MSSKKKKKKSIILKMDQEGNSDLADSKNIQKQKSIRACGKQYLRYTALIVKRSGN